MPKLDEAQIERALAMHAAGESFRAIGRVLKITEHKAKAAVVPSYAEHMRALGRAYREKCKARGGEPRHIVRVPEIVPELFEIIDFGPQPPVSREAIECGIRSIPEAIMRRGNHDREFRVSVPYVSLQHA